MSIKKSINNKGNYIINSYRRFKGGFYRNKYKILNELNTGKLSSPTNYFIYVKLSEFMTYVYKKNNSTWNLDKSFLCSIGKPSTPTIVGKYKVQLKGEYFGENRGYKCLYYTQIERNYLFHSIVYNLNGTIRDGRLGLALSDGCIRLATQNAKWIWNNVPKNSSILIDK